MTQDGPGLGAGELIAIGCKGSGDEKDASVKIVDVTPSGSRFRLRSGVGAATGI